MRDSRPGALPQKIGSLLVSFQVSQASRCSNFGPEASSPIVEAKLLSSDHTHLWQPPRWSSVWQPKSVLMMIRISCLTLTASLGFLKSMN